MKILETLGDRIRRDELLSKRTTYRLGGPARFFFEAKTAEEAQSAIRAARQDGLKIFVLGGGSNVLVSDAGFDGLVLSSAGRSVQAGSGSVTAEAGAPLSLLVSLAANAGLGGLDWAAGIPGTVGGAVRGNAGAYGGEIKDSLSSVRAIDLETGDIREFSLAECRFGYRDSFFKHAPWLIWSASFALPAGDKAALQRRIAELIAERRGKFPIRYGNAGSVFKNTAFRSADELPEAVRRDLPQKYLEFRKVPTAWLVERLGLKGRSLGGAKVSEDHGNFIVNAGGATAAEVRELIGYVKMSVKKEAGIDLFEEIEYVGF